MRVCQYLNSKVELCRNILTFLLTSCSKKSIFLRHIWFCIRSSVAVLETALVPKKSLISWFESGMRQRHFGQVFEWFLKAMSELIRVHVWMSFVILHFTPPKERVQEKKKLLITIELNNMNSRHITWVCTSDDKHDRKLECRLKASWMFRATTGKWDKKSLWNFVNKRFE